MSYIQALYIQLTVRGIGSSHSRPFTNITKNKFT